MVLLHLVILNSIQRFLFGADLLSGPIFHVKVFLKFTMKERKSYGQLMSYYTHQNEDDRSPELGVNRHSIATGLSPTPIAARESHIKHQMTLREDAYTDIHDFTYVTLTGVE